MRLVNLFSAFFLGCLAGNGTCAGTCFIYLRPTAMPVGLAGLNINKIVLRAVLGGRASQFIIISFLIFSINPFNFS